MLPAQYMIQFQRNSVLHIRPAPYQVSLSTAFFPTLYTVYNINLSFGCRYSIVSSSPEERKMFRVLHMQYVVLDEAHMLKNMATQRYDNLARINVSKRITMSVSKR